MNKFCMLKSCHRSNHDAYHLAALFTSLLLECHLSKVGNGRGQLEGVCLLLCTEAKGVESNIGELQFLGVIDGVYLDLPLGEEEVVIRIGAHEDEFLKTVDDPRLDKLEEDVVASLVGLLVSHPGFLEEVDVNEATSQLSHVVEVDPNELTWRKPL